jgi:uncharacterized protein YgfB (UPF0149 family)
MVGFTEPTFDALKQALRSAGALGETEEIHGEFCGLVCLMGREAVAPWIADVIRPEGSALGVRPEGSAPGADNASSQAAAGMLEALAARTWQSLDEGDMSFSPLLPTDEAPLELRADSLGLWCQGFVHGLGVAGTQDDANSIFKTGVTRDIVKDFSEIARAAFADEETEGEGEAAYMELVEYVRVSVQLVFEELHRLRTGPAGPAAH